jgi:hypothetical protein
VKRVREGTVLPTLTWHLITCKCAYAEGLPNSDKTSGVGVLPVMITVRIRGPNGAATLPSALKPFTENLACSTYAERSSPVKEINGSGMRWTVLPAIVSWRCSQATSARFAAHMTKSVPVRAVPHDCTVMTFQEHVAAACSVAPASQRFKTGFPPRLLLVTDVTMPVSNWGLRNGDLLILEAQAEPSNTIQIAEISQNGEQQMSQDEQFERALAASRQDMAPTQSQPQAKQPQAAEPEEVPTTFARPASKVSDDDLVACSLPDGRCACRCGGLPKIPFIPFKRAMIRTYCTNK